MPKIGNVIMQELLDQLSRTFEVLGKEGVAPAISNEEFQRLIVRPPFSLPSDLEKIYRWHDGVKEIIPAYDLLSLSDSIIQYEEIVEFLEEEEEEEYLFNKNYLPIFQFDGDYFLIDCSPNSENTIYYFSYESDLVKEYENLEQVFHIISDAYLSRAYYIEDGMVLENSVLLRKIENKYWSQDELDKRESEWNRLLAEINELKSIDTTQKPVAAEVNLQDLSNVFGLTEPEAIQKELDKIEAEWSKVLSELSDLTQMYSSQDSTAGEIKRPELSVVFGLASPVDLQKRSLIRRLTETYDKRAIDFLVEFLNDENPEMIASAAYGLGQLQSRERLPELVKLTMHPAVVVRNQATCAIADMVSPNDGLLLEPLLKLLSDSETLVRIAAVRAIGQLQNVKATQSLFGLLQDQNSGVRYQTIQALGKIGDAGALEILKQRKNVASPQEVRIIDDAIHLIEK